MCGIVGQWNKSSPVMPSNFEVMVDTLENRGPDGKKACYFDAEHIALGHTRLSIIDLSPNGAQPICNEDERLWLTFNGEIYNHKELRRELIRLGHCFKSTSDSEVIIHGYEAWGQKVLEKLRGIFAFAIYNSRDQTLFLARDHAGVKPLYYYHSKETFVFASEPKAILKASKVSKNISQRGLALYLAYGNLPGEHSIFEDIHKVLPGHSLTFQKGEIKQYEAFWRLQYDPIIKKEKEAIELVHEAIVEAIRMQCESDVPIASLLSGGIDSTIVTSELQSYLPYKLNTFNIGFDIKRSDESEFAKETAKFFKTEHHTQQLTLKDALSGWSSLIATFDEPFLATSLFPYLSLAKLVRKRGFKVAMGGDGADELFAGYKWYDAFYKAYDQTTVKKWARKLKGTYEPFSTGINRFSKYNGYFFEEEQKKILKNVASHEALITPLKQHFNLNLPPVLAAQFMDFHVFMPDHCLTKVDRVGMSQGLEIRVPFLDQSLLKLLFQIDHDIMYKGKERKWLLKAAMKNAIPLGIDHRRKKGFSSPVDDWINATFSGDSRDIISSGSFITSGLVIPDGLLEVYDQSTADGKLLLLGLEMWHRYWIEGEMKPLLPKVN